MKKTLSFLFVLLMVEANAQTVLENPKTGMCTTPGLNIQKIELKDSVSVFTFHLKYQPGTVGVLPKTTFLLTDKQDTLHII